MISSNTGPLTVSGHIANLRQRATVWPLDLLTDPEVAELAATGKYVLVWATAGPFTGPETELMRSSHCESAYVMKAMALRTAAITFTGRMEVRKRAKFFLWHWILVLVGKAWSRVLVLRDLELPAPGRAAVFSFHQPPRWVRPEDLARLAHDLYRAQGLHASNHN